MHYAFGDYELDDQLYELSRTGAPVELERKVYDVLVYLVQHRNRLVTKDELLEKLWPGQVVGEAALTRCITSARKALGDDGDRQEFIKTQHGRGYRFVAPLLIAEPIDKNQEEENQKVKDKEQRAKVEETELETEKTEEADTGPRTSAPGLLQPAVLSPYHAPSPAPAHLWLWANKTFALVVVVLLVGTILTVHFLSRSSLGTRYLPLGTEEAQPPLPLPDKPSIAVLPFANLSDDPQQEYFGYGLTIDLVTDLSKLSGLVVIARHSTLIYKDKFVNVQEVSKELGVRYVVDGSVRKVGDRLLITAQLVDGITGQEVWAERYDRAPQDLFAVQEEVRRKILVHLGLKLTPEEEEQ